MKNIKFLVAGFLIATTTAYAQTSVQPVQPATHQTGVQPNSGRIQTSPNGQIPASQTVQTSRTVIQQTQSSQTGQPQSAVNGQATYPDAQQVQTAPVVRYDANGQVIVADPQAVKVQYDADGKEVQTSPRPVETVTTGQVPKVYTNTQSTLPFQQYQPKPTGQISPMGARPGSAPARSGSPRR